MIVGEARTGGGARRERKSEHYRDRGGVAAIQSALKGSKQKRAAKPRDSSKQPTEQESAQTSSALMLWNARNTRTGGSRGSCLTGWMRLVAGSRRRGPWRCRRGRPGSTALLPPGDANSDGQGAVRVLDKRGTGLQQAARRVEAELPIAPRQPPARDEARQSARRRQSAAAARHCGSLASGRRSRFGTNPATSWPGWVATASERKAATARTWLLEAWMGSVGGRRGRSRRQPQVADALGLTDRVQLGKRSSPGSAPTS
jgi:hypothetical protein